MLEALLWDVDGTLAETERDGHLVAFNQAFAALNIPCRWSERRYGELLAVAGGRERLLHDMRSQEWAPQGEEARRELAENLHRRKNRFYETIVRGAGLPLRPGVVALLDDCRRAGLPMAIVTTTSRSNVDALLQTHLGVAWESRFAAVVCAEDAPIKKPDPQAYRLALDVLKLTSQECIAMEDAPAGIAAAQAAGLPVIVARSHYFPGVAAAGVLAHGPSLGQREGWQPTAEPGATRIGLEQIRGWYRMRHRIGMAPIQE